MTCKDKVAIVTGAAGNGMGRSIALTLAREGAAVVVNYLTSSDSAAAIVAHIDKKGGRAFAFEADVTQQDQCKALVDSAIEEFGRVDICVIGPGAGWHTEPPDKLDSTAALDDVQKELAPIYHLMPLVLPAMYERRWGRPITIALAPPYNSPAYSYNVAKDARALHMLSRLLSQHRFDIVHTHGSKAGAVGRIAAALTASPIRLHSPHCFAFLRNGRRRIDRFKSVRGRPQPVRGDHRVPAGRL